MLVEGFTFGFEIGYVGQGAVYQSKNLRSASDLPEVINKKLYKEISLGRIAGPFEQQPFENVHISLLGVVPKKVPGTYRLLHHLSYPHGDSINNHIPDEFSKVSSQTIDNAVGMIK